MSPTAVLILAGLAVFLLAWHAWRVRLRAPVLAVSLPGATNRGPTQRDTATTQAPRVAAAVPTADEIYREFLDNFPTPVWRSGPDGCEYVNRTWTAFTGQSLEDARGQGWLECVHPDDREHVFGYARAAVQRRRPFEHEYRVRRHDGEYRHVVDVGRPYWLGGAYLGYMGSIHDVTERVQAAALLQGERRVLEVLNSGAPLGDVLDALCLNVERQAPDLLCSILLLEHSRLRSGAAPHLPPSYVEAIDGVEIGPAVGSCGTAAYHNRRVITQDIHADPHWNAYRDLADRHGLRACWSEPIRGSKGEVLGTFAMYYREPRLPSDGELRLIERAASLASVAIERKQAEERLAEETALMELARRIAVAANDASEPREAYRHAAHLIMEAADWDAAHVFVVSEEPERGLIPTNIWWAVPDLEAAEAFRRATMDSRFTVGEGLPGIAMRDRMPQWLTHLPEHMDQQRRAAALASGIVTAMTIPVLAGKDVHAVLEFFSRSPRPRDALMVGEAAHIGAVLGRVAERAAAERALRTARDRMLNLFHSNPLPCAIMRAADGTFIEVNDRLAEFLDHSLTEMLGRTPTALGVWVDPERQRSVLDELETRRSIQCELQVRMRTGAVRDVLASLQLVDLDGESCAVVSLVDITDRKLSEEMLRRSRTQLRALSQRLVEVQEMERARIARELHDHIGQALTAVKLSVEGVGRRARDAKSCDRVQESVAVIDRAIQEVRTLSWDLRPAMLDDLGLAAAVSAYVKRQARSAGIEAQLTLPPDDIDLPSEIETACFRILQEAVVNVLRHARASRLTVTLAADGAHLELRVADDGVGIEAGEPGDEAPQHLGFASMRERAELAGASLRIESEPGRGTTVTVRFGARAEGTS